MPHYRLYRLEAGNRRIGSAVDIDGETDDEAIKQAADLDHEHIVEVWQGARLVKRVEPQ